jgi:YVTN family beta-propeller protein
VRHPRCTELAPCATPGENGLAVGETARDNVGEVEFRVLGPLEVTAAGRSLPLGGRKQRTLLAMLLLHANELVSRDQLIDAMWGEELPAEADASLRVYVARLRKLFATEPNGRPSIETGGNGYVLRVDPESVDVKRFRRLVADGEFARALDLWRGPALADLTHEDWARRESGVLEELRLNALEERVETDLANGRHADLVAELELLVDEHPSRERFVRQLMVALYRCERQQDALRAYARSRDELRERFGLEPTRELRELERRILVQDPALDLPKRSPTGTPAQAPRSSRGLLVVAAIIVVLAVAGTMLALARDDSAGGEPVVLRGNSVVAIDAGTDRVLGEVPLGGRPSGIAVGLGSVWAGNVDDETLLRINPRTRRVVETIGLGAAPTAMAIGAGSVWVLSLEENAVLQVDPAINEVVGRIPLGSLGELAGTGAAQIVFARGVIWVRPGQQSTLLMQIDPRTHAVALVRRDVNGMASDGRALWGLLGLIEAKRIQRLYPPGPAIDFDRVGAIPGLLGMAVGQGAVWVSSRGAVAPRIRKGTLWRIDPISGRVVSSVLLERAVLGIALVRGAVWIVTHDAHVLRVDPNAGRVTKTLPLGVYAPHVAAPIAAGEGTIWVAALEG